MGGIGIMETIISILMKKNLPGESLPEPIESYPTTCSTCAHILRQAPDSADDADDIDIGDADARETPSKLPIWRSITWDGTLDIKNLIIACEYMSYSQ
jgi:hypothetical protein